MADRNDKKNLDAKATQITVAKLQQMSRAMADAAAKCREALTRSNQAKQDCKGI